MTSSSLDDIDAAFLARWQRSPPTVPETPSEPAPSAATAAAQPDPAPPARADTVSAPPTDEPGMAARLLAAARPQWDALATHVEAARLRGRRVIAVAGGEAGEGRTTLVECLHTVLRERGRDVVRTDIVGLSGGGAAAGAGHDKRIVLVDAGIWFPPGPIHRQRLMVASLGCDAAILVRRADRLGGAARQAALESFGVEVLGEVLTFTDDERPSFPEEAI